MGQSRTGALLVLAACFALSAALRAGEVVAQLASERPDLAAAAAEYAGRLDPQLAEADRLARALDERRAALEEEEAAIAEREAALAEAEDRLAERLTQMKAVRTELAETLALARGAAARDVAHLADAYARMKPKQAGALFNAMEPGFAAGFLAEMPPEAAAGVLAAMAPERAYAVSVLLAGRHVGEGREARP
jgi:flagellar motility protein MotE (MotC chaperone)